MVKEFMDTEAIIIIKNFFRKITKEIIRHYKLSDGCKILDIGCAKGFMMYEFRQFLPNAEIWGLDISKYCKTSIIPILNVSREYKLF